MASSRRLEQLVSGSGNVWTLTPETPASNTSTLPPLEPSYCSAWARDPPATCSRSAAWRVFYAAAGRDGTCSAPGRRPPSCTGWCTPNPVLDRVPPRLPCSGSPRCLAKDPAARPSFAAGAVRRDRGRHGRHRAVRGGVLAVLGGPPDRRLPGQGGGGDAEHQGPRGRVLLGHGRAPADHAVRPGARPPQAAGAASRPPASRAALALLRARRPAGQPGLAGGAAGQRGRAVPGAARLPDRQPRRDGAADRLPAAERDPITRLDSACCPPAW